MLESNSEADMTERDFLILKYLSEFQNITKTAEALFIYQPALTARIKQLELELDTKLIQNLVEKDLCEGA